jgi:type IV pilus assembly protein PilA
MSRPHREDHGGLSEKDEEPLKDRDSCATHGRVKVFCTRCGLEKELEETARSAIVTCVGCGNRFSAGPPLSAPSHGPSTAIIIGIVAVLAVPVIVAVIGILAAIAIPNFIKFQSRSKQHECQENLKALAGEAGVYFSENRRYTTKVRELSFEPERGNRYAYFLGDGTLESRDGATAEHHDTDAQVGVDRFRFPDMRELGPDQIPHEMVAGIEGTCPDCTFTAVCVGNIDNDDTLDVWSISMKERHRSSGEVIPALAPFNDVNDVTE